MKTIRNALVPLLLLSAVATVQAENVPAPAACTQVVDSLAKAPAVHRVSQSSVAHQSANRNQIYWINSRSRSEQKSPVYKSKCVTGAEGEVVSLRVEQGYWE